MQPFYHVLPKLNAEVADPFEGDLFNSFSLGIQKQGAIFLQNHPSSRLCRLRDSTRGCAGRCQSRGDCVP
jgi:hypothetical protein